MKNFRKGTSIILAIGTVALVAILIGAAIFYQQQKAGGGLGLKPSPTPNEEVSSATESTTEPTEALLPGIMNLKVYFGNRRFNPDGDCGRVYSLNRDIPLTQAVAKASLRELFAGPTLKEKEEGYTSFFSEKTENILKKIKIENGVAYVDLADIRTIIPNASTSCGGAQFLAEVDKTLKQFSTIKKVIFAINGDPKTFYDWIQIGCSLENNDCDPTPFK